MADPLKSDSVDGEEQILRVASGSSASQLAIAISHAVYDSKRVTLRAIGAAAVNQAIKGVAIAQSHVGLRGLTLYCRPGFLTVKMKDADVSAIVIRVEAK